jgi:hypothetical protein
MTIDNIKLLIADNKIEQATNELLQLAKSETPLLNQVILLKNQFKDYTQNINLNLMERNEERAKVINGLLYVADEIGKNGPQMPVHTEGVVLRGSSEILAVLWVNMYGFLTKNVEIVKESLHPQSPNLGQVEAYLNQLFVQDLTYHIVSLEVLEQKGNQARVKMVLETRSLKPVPNFKDNLTVSIQYLATDENGYWKIWGSEFLELKSLD